MSIEPNKYRWELDSEIASLSGSRRAAFHEHTFYDLLRKSINAAIKEGIEANSIVINENMVKVSEHFNPDVRHLFPPMICGLNVYFTKDELPENYSFAILEAPNRSDRLAEFESIGMDPDELKKAAKLYRYFKDVEEGLV